MRDRRRAASAPWSPAESRVLERYVQQVLSGRFDSALEAASSCRRELKRRPGFSRTEHAVYSRLCGRLREAGRRLHRPWTAAEVRVIDRCAREFAAGRYESVIGAVRVCVERLTRLPESDRPPGEARGVGGVYRAFARRTAASHRCSHSTRWRPEERSVAERFAQGLVDGRFRNVEEAVTACARELARLSRQQSGALAPARPRSLKAINGRLWMLAHAAGRPARWAPYKDWEQAIIDGYVQALVQGRYRDPLVAARDCRRDLNRRRSKCRGQDVPPMRGLKLLRNQLRLRAYRLGWSWRNRLWLPGEKRILDRHVRRLVRPNPPLVQQVARDCRREFRELHARLSRSDPGRRKAYRERTLATLQTYLAKMSRQAGRIFYPRWTPGQERTLRRYARAVVSGRYLSASEAGDACYEEMFEPGTGKPGSVQDRDRAARTRLAVQNRVRKLAHGFGERWPKTSWTAPELELLNRAVDWYERHRGVRRLCPGEAAITGLQTELEQIGSHRALEGCRGRFWKEWHRRHGS